jgi:hypothetical protein
VCLPASTQLLASRAAVAIALAFIYSSFDAMHSILIDYALRARLRPVANNAMRTNMFKQLKTSLAAHPVHLCDPAGLSSEGSADGHAGGLPPSAMLAKHFSRAAGALQRDPAATRAAEHPMANHAR